MRLSLVLAASLVLALPALARADGDLRARTGATLATMKGDAQRIASMLAQARRGGTPEQRRCLDLALSEADAAVRTGSDDVTAARAAAKARDKAAASRAMASLAVKRAAARAAVFAADACVAPPGAVVGPRDATVVRVFVDPNLPPDSALFGH